jgi:peroxiredoxin
VTDQFFDAALARLEQDATPEPAFADRLFSQLATEAGFRGGSRPIRRLLPGLPRIAGLPTATRLAWIAIALGSLLVVLMGLLLAGGSPRPVLETVVVPSVAPTSSVMPLRPDSGVLDVGTEAPVWSGSLLGGGSFSTAELRGRPAAILMWCTCVSGDYARRFLEEAGRRGDVAMVLVAMDSEATTQGLVNTVGSDTPVVLDEQYDLLEAWDLSYFPALVLLRADGTVADLQPMTFDAESLTAIIDSLAAGGPLPEPAPFPSPPVDAEGRQPLSTVLDVGARAPELAGPLLGGGELSTSELAGKPAVVLFWAPPRLDGTPQDDEPPPDALLEAVAERGDELNIVLIARGEPEPGAAAAYLEDHDADVPVIFDWDGELHRRWGLVMFTTLVLLDGEGQVAGYYGGSALNDPSPMLDALIAGEPLPSPPLLGP